MRNILITILLSASLTTFAQRGPTPVFTKKARMADIVNRQTVTGSLQSAKISNVAGIEAGRVEEVQFKIGDQIKKGQLLARVDDRHIKHDIAAADAELKELEASAKKLNRELEIQKLDLRALEVAVKKFKGSVSAKEIRRSRLVIVSTEGLLIELNSSKETLKVKKDKLNTALVDTIIKAPFDGVILERFIEKGAWLASGGKVGQLQSYDLEAVIEVPEKINPEDLKEDIIKIYTKNSSPPLKISSLRLLPQIDTESRNYKMIATLKPGQKLIPGMSLQAEVPNGKKQQHLLIPTDAIQRNGAGYFVFKVIPGKKGTSALPVKVTILFRSGNETAVISPTIKAGDEIIVEGNERLFPMMPVKAKILEK